MKSRFESEQLNLEDSEDKDFEPDVPEQLESVEEDENEDKIGVLVKKKIFKNCPAGCPRFSGEDFKLGSRGIFDYYIDLNSHHRL